MASTFLRKSQINLRQIAKYSINSTRYSDTTLSTNFTHDEKTKILNTLNDSTEEQLSMWRVSQSRIKNLESWKKRRGPFQTLNDVLDVEGLSETILRNLYENIVNNPVEELLNKSKPASLRNKRTKQLVTPVLCENVVNTITTATGIHLTPMGISWARLSCDKNKLTNWNFEDFSSLPQKMLPSETFDQALNLVRHIPPSDLYIFEANHQLGPQGQTQSATVSSYTQKQELTSMLLALLNTSVNHNMTLQNPSEDRSNQTTIENRVFFLRSKLPARLFRTLVGNEKVAAGTIITELVENDGKNKLFNLPCTPITIEDQLRDAFMSRASPTKELLGQALLLVISFMDLCIYKNSTSLSAISSRKK
ncbi:unnamed protein product [Phaedon cochleariae]|uniref:Transcription elongation factor, mitochondrial n=1 Tax=Phaedon cochleariae TaxID=80249 RepID=A0A9P0DGE9_PHACE|nr:unnamed protein product [Phaedon cochleariae]